MLKDINYYGISLKGVQVEITHINLYETTWHFSVKYVYEGTTLPTGDNYSIPYVKGQDPVEQAETYLNSL